MVKRFAVLLALSDLLLLLLGYGQAAAAARSAKVIKYGGGRRYIGTRVIIRGLTPRNALGCRMHTVCIRYQMSVRPMCKQPLTNFSSACTKFMSGRGNLPADNLPPQMTICMSQRDEPEIFM
jgi:hypothetical protein